MNKTFRGRLVNLFYGCFDSCIFVRRVSGNGCVSLLIAVLSAVFCDLLRCALLLLMSTRFFADLMLGMVTPPLLHR
jgi:hypothetical protein